MLLWNSNRHVSPNKLALIGWGGMGCNLMAQLAAELEPRQHADKAFLAANTDYNMLEAHFHKRPKGHVQDWIKSHALEVLHLQIKGDGRETLGAGTIPEVGEQAARDADSAIRMFINKHRPRACILAAGFGKGTGTGGAGVVAEILELLGVPTIAVAAYPDANLGSAPIDKAKIWLPRLKQHATTIVLKNDMMMEHPQVMTKSMRELHSEMNRICIMRPLIMLTEMMQATGLVQNTDVADMMTVANHGQNGLWGFWEKDKDHPFPDAQTIVNALITNQYQDSRILSRAATMVIHYHGDFSVKLYNDVNDLFKRRMNQNATQIIPGTYESEQQECWIGFFAAAPDDTNSQTINKPRLVATNTGDGHAVTGLNTKGESVVLRLGTKAAEPWYRLKDLPAPTVEETAKLMEWIETIRREHKIHFQLPPAHQANQQKQQGNSRFQRLLGRGNT